MSIVDLVNSSHSCDIFRFRRLNFISSPSLLIFVPLALLLCSAILVIQNFWICSADAYKGGRGSLFLWPEFYVLLYLLSKILIYIADADIHGLQQRDKGPLNNFIHLLEATFIK